MEILIIGIIFVTLMAYVSTRIKKSAATAYEPEIIETDEFFLVKPEGFISPIGGKSAFAFEAYSKDFGESDATEKLYRAEASLKISDDENFAGYCQSARQNFDEVLAEETVIRSPDGQKIFLLKAETKQTDAPAISYRKIIGGERRIYDLQVTVLSESFSTFGERIEQMLETFRVK